MVTIDDRDIERWKIEAKRGDVRLILLEEPSDDQEDDQGDLYVGQEDIGRLGLVVFVNNEPWFNLAVI